MDTLEGAENENPLVLLTGAPGYVAGRLLPLLEKQPIRLRCLSRHPEILKPQVADSTEVLKGDLLRRATLEPALKGVHTAYYLVHSMGSKGSFVMNDRLAALNFSTVAKAAGVKRIIYLGALGSDADELSPHIQSRKEVGKILRQFGTPVIEFRASIVIGSGSLSFEMIRLLVERMPLMITPRWVKEPAQPISTTDLINYLSAGLHAPCKGNKIYQIGGSEQMSYGAIMKLYAHIRGIPLVAYTLPFCSPRLVSLFMRIITPDFARIGRNLILGVSHASIVENDNALTDFPIQPMNVKEMIQQALNQDDSHFAETHWSDAVLAIKPERWGSVNVGSRLVDSRITTIQASTQESFATIEKIGGDTGWYAWNRLWHLRAFIDRIFGGPGMRRGRPHTLKVGEKLDFWEIEEVDEGRHLRLAADMKVPGRAWLDFEVLGDEETSTIYLTAIFDPSGAFGRIYWYLLYPLHHLVFVGMLNGIKKATLASIVSQKR